MYVYLENRLDPVVNCKFKRFWQYFIIYFTKTCYLPMFFFKICCQQICIAVITLFLLWICMASLKYFIIHYLPILIFISSVSSTLWFELTSETNSKGNFSYRTKVFQDLYILIIRSVFCEFDSPTVFIDCLYVVKYRGFWFWERTIFCW